MQMLISCSPSSWISQASYRLPCGGSGMALVEIVNVSATAVPSWKRSNPTDFPFTIGVRTIGALVDSLVGNSVSIKDTTVGFVRGGSVPDGMFGSPFDKIPFRIKPQKQRASAPAARLMIRFQLRTFLGLGFSVAGSGSGAAI